MLYQLVGDVETVVDAEIKDEDVLLGLNALRCEFSVDGMFASANGFVLVIYYGSCSHCTVFAEISGETWNGGDHYDDPESAVFIVCSFNSFDNGSTDGVVNGVLLIAGSGDCKTYY